MESPYFLTTYVYEIFSEMSNIIETYTSVLKHLKLKTSEQLVFCLGIYVY